MTDVLADGAVVAVAGTMGTDHAVGPDHVNQARFSKTRLVVEAREVIRIERGDGNAAKRSVRLADAPGQLNRLAPRCRVLGRYTHIGPTCIRGLMDPKVRPISKVDGCECLTTLDQTALFVDHAEKDERFVIRENPLLDHPGDVHGRAVQLILTPENTYDQVRDAQRFLAVLLESPREGLVGVDQMFGFISTISADGVDNFRPQDDERDGREPEDPSTGPDPLAPARENRTWEGRRLVTACSRRGEVAHPISRPIDRPISRGVIGSKKSPCPPIRRRRSPAAPAAPA